MSNAHLEAIRLAVKGASKVQIKILIRRSYFYIR